MEFLEFKELYDSLKYRYSQINKYLDLEIIKSKINKLKDKTLEEEFWNDKNNASDILKNARSHLRRKKEQKFESTPMAEPTFLYADGSPVSVEKFQSSKFYRK